MEAITLYAYDLPVFDFNVAQDLFVAAILLYVF